MANLRLTLIFTPRAKETIIMALKEIRRGIRKEGNQKNPAKFYRNEDYFEISAMFCL